MRSIRNRNLSGCIYCGAPGPFSDEHVVCAGLGGDDSGWMLRGLVCAKCNTDVFSKLETKFLRSSPVALMRLFLQPRTRNRGKATGAPKLQTKSTYILDESIGVLLEGNFEAGGVGSVLPQVGAMSNLTIYRAGPDEKNLTQFLMDSLGALAEHVDLIEKRREGSEVSFKLTSLDWELDHYAVAGSSSASVRPKSGIWTEELMHPATEPNGFLGPRLFRRPGGQIVCRAETPEQAVDFLGALKRIPDVFQSQAVTNEDRKVSGGGIHQRMDFDFSASDRVLTKIGLNLTVYLLGEAVIRDPAMNKCVDYAREGKGNVLKYPPDVTVKMANIYGKALPDRHLFALNESVNNSGGRTLIFMARLYGGPLEGIVLGEFVETLPASWVPIIVHVNYVTHSVSRLTLEEHVVELVQAHPEDPFGLNETISQQDAEA